MDKHSIAHNKCRWKEEEEEANVNNEDEPTKRFNQQPMAYFRNNNKIIPYSHNNRNICSASVVNWFFFHTARHTYVRAHLISVNYENAQQQRRSDNDHDDDE